jgi:hypothetical protein
MWQWYKAYTPAALYPQDDSWYSFLPEAELTPGPQCSWKDYVNWKIQWPCSMLQPTMIPCAHCCYIKYIINIPELALSQELNCYVSINIVTDPRKSGPLPLNGELVTDVISAVTDTDSYPITCNGWAKRCIRGNHYALWLDRSVSPVTNR